MKKLFLLALTAAGVYSALKRNGLIKSKTT
jgi:hypothetical protein